MYVAVAIDLALDRLFTYSVPVDLTEKLRVGQLLRVPFHGRVARGFAMALAEAAPAFKTKPVLAIEDDSPFFSPALLKLVRWIAAYTASPVETVLKAAVPAAVLRPGARARELLFVEASGKAEPCHRDCSEQAGPLGRAASPWPLEANPPPGENPPPAPPGPLTARQRALVAEIRRVGGGWLNQITREFKTTPATLRAIAAKGALTIAPRAKRRDPLAGRHVLPTSPLPLNPLQAAALEKIFAPSPDGKALPCQNAPAARDWPPYQAAPLVPNSPDGKALPCQNILLHGVTGSGKTEIYLQAIARVLAAGKDAIVLVPEIALTPQTVRRFAGRFGDRIAVLHSALSDGERYDEWHRIRTGAARVVIGPRSAVFAPVRALGLIVVDEEHDPSYKQDDTPRYHARDVAVMRARLEGARVVLGSATPSLESWRNAQTGKYALASVPARVAGRSLPAVHLVNMEEEAAKTGRAPIFSGFLLDAIRERLDRGEQTILFLNRRGYARVLSCPACDWTAQCPDCSVPYTYHRADNCLRCHICGGWAHLPAVCPDCHGRDFTYTGIGTQRAEAALRRCFPSARVLRMDADSTSRKMSHDDILSAFRAGRADILLGTQMIAKGLDFPNVTLVGVLNADASLHRPDPRAGERTYQLLAQVSGRAGRAEKPGEVYIQTFAPDAPPVAAAASADGFAAFAAAELAARRDAYLPPYCRLATLTFRAQSEPRARAWADLYARSLAAWAAKAGDAFRVSDAAEAPLAKAEGWYRWQIVLRAPAAKDITAAVKWVAKERPVPKDVRVAFDVDALNLG